MRLGSRSSVAGWALLPLLSLLTLSGHSAMTSPQPGTVSCTQVTGSVRFDPPLTNDGSASEVASLLLVVKGCAAGGGGSTPRLAHGSTELSMTSSSCANLSSGSKTTVNIAISWRPTKDGSTEVNFPGYSLTSTSDLGFSLGGEHTSASGSYAGTDAGASSTATVTFNLTPAKVEVACGTRKGLKSLKIQTGLLSLK